MTTIDDKSSERIAGIYYRENGESDRLVHEYTDEDYGLEDIRECFGLGRIETIDDETTIVLDDTEIRKLKVRADAESFDHPEDFILMCLDLQRFSLALGPGSHRFHEVA